MCISLIKQRKYRTHCFKETCAIFVLICANLAFKIKAMWNTFYLSDFS